MKRRQLLLGFAGALSGCDSAVSVTQTQMPEKIRLVPDQWHIQHVGRLDDGRLFWTDSQLTSNGRSTRDYVCTFIFDSDGHLVENEIELIGVRGDYTDGAVERAIDRQLGLLGALSGENIWVRPFNVEHEGVTFGLIPRRLEDGEWRVEFMPGNTLSFYPPWDAGEYDT